MILTCNNCESQLNHSLSCMPAKWRDPIAYSLCKLFESKPRHCEIDFNFYLCDLPTKWREEMVELLCEAFTVTSCDLDCSQCKSLFTNYLSSFPEEWREKIIIIICDIIQTKGCHTPPCVTYLITPFIGIDQAYEYTYLDCYRERMTGVITIDDAPIICAIEGSLEIDSRFSVIKISNECDLETDRCLCLTILNILWDVPHFDPHTISYEDCDGNVFTDVDVDGLPSTQICARPSSIVTNYGYSAISAGPCIDTCVVGPCYQYWAKNISEDETVIFSYEACGTEQPTVVNLEPLETHIFCSLSPVISGSVNLEVNQIGNCG